jgi:hypothetical protein
MVQDKQEFEMAWDLVRELEKVVAMLWERYPTAFMELDRAEIERKQNIQSDSRAEEVYPF